MTILSTAKTIIISRIFSLKKIMQQLTFRLHSPVSYFIVRRNRFYPRRFLKQCFISIANSRGFPAQLGNIHFPSSAGKTREVAIVLKNSNQSTESSERHHAWICLYKCAYIYKYNLVMLYYTSVSVFKFKLE